MIVATIKRSISIHAPHARSDYVKHGTHVGTIISIHAPHARSDDAAQDFMGQHMEFQSTLLMRGATTCSIFHYFTSLFQSTLLMRGATFRRARSAGRDRFQSTLLMRGATRWSDTWPGDDRREETRFQSTLLMRGATPSCLLSHHHYRHFNPRSSCEERRTRRLACVELCRISIHAPHARSDQDITDKLSRQYDISIHAPHARSDLIGLIATAIIAKFQSTLLMRGATRLPTPLPPSVIAFQSTLLMRGATSIILGQTVGRCEFQSTLLMRGATAGPPFSCAYKAISIHAPHARSDPHGEQDWRCVGFQSTLLMRGAT